MFTITDLPASQLRRLLIQAHKRGRDIFVDAKLSLAELLVVGVADIHQQRINELDNRVRKLESRIDELENRS